MYYILTTYFDNHWDNVRDNRTSYKRKFLSFSEGDLADNTPTVFLRIDRTSGNIEKAWLGKVLDIKFDQDSIRFSIEIEKEIEVDPEFAQTKIGWYVIPEDLNISQEPENTLNLNPHQINGNWDNGWALDLHTLHSILLPDGKFDTTYTYLGNAVNKLKYWKDKNFIPIIIDEVFKFINGKEFRETKKRIDVIVPIPPSDITRSFQPVYELAIELSKRTRIQIDTEYLVKLKSTSQIKSIDDKTEREKILKDAFNVIDNRYQGKNVLLLDDLYRSGSTMTEITNTLKQKGNVNEIFVLTMTKTRTKK